MLEKGRIIERVAPYKGKRVTSRPYANAWGHISTFNKDVAAYRCFGLNYTANGGKPETCRNPRLWKPVAIQILRPLGPLPKCSILFT